MTNDHDDDLLSSKEIGDELSKAFPSLKVVLEAIEANSNIPSLSTSLECCSPTDPPNRFMETKLDYFGGHICDLKSAKPGKPVKGAITLSGDLRREYSRISKRSHEKMAAPGFVSPV
jgi:6-phosphogluconate dehydrogenase